MSPTPPARPMAASPRRRTGMAKGRASTRRSAGTRGGGRARGSAKAAPAATPPASPGRGKGKGAAATAAAPAPAASDREFVCLAGVFRGQVHAGGPGPGFAWGMQPRSDAHRHCMLRRGRKVPYILPLTCMHTPCPPLHPQAPCAVVASGRMRRRRGQGSTRTLG